MAKARCRDQQAAIAEYTAAIELSKVPDDVKSLKRRLHKLSGASALFGLHAVTTQVNDISRDLDAMSQAALEEDLGRLQMLCHETRARFAEALDPL